MEGNSKQLQRTDLLNMHAGRLVQRDIDQLLGICEFSLQDGYIDQSEAECLLEWLDNHGACLDTWPANILYERLVRMLGDKTLDVSEHDEVLCLIMSIAKPRTASGDTPPSTLPLDIPPPAVIIAAHNFCFTGVFEFGSREDCQSAVTQRGGNVLKGITKKLDYLIIGECGSEVWRHSSFGAKIAKAVEYRAGGVPIAIITETHWRKHL